MQWQPIGRAPAEIKSTPVKSRARPLLKEAQTTLQRFQPPPLPQNYDGFTKHVNETARQNSILFPLAKALGSDGSGTRLSPLFP